MMELVSKASPQWSVFEWKHCYSAIDFTLFMHFPTGSSSRTGKEAVSIFYVVSTNKENDQWVETAGQTQLKGKFVMIMEQK